MTNPYAASFPYASARQLLSLVMMMMICNSLPSICRLSVLFLFSFSQSGFMFSLKSFFFVRVAEGFRTKQQCIAFDFAM